MNKLIKLTSLALFIFLTGCVGNPIPAHKTVEPNKIDNAGDTIVVIQNKVQQTLDKKIYQ